MKLCESMEDRDKLSSLYQVANANYNSNDRITAYCKFIEKCQKSFIKANNICNENINLQGFITTYIDSHTQEFQLFLEDSKISSSDVAKTIEESCYKETNSIKEY